MCPLKSCYLTRSRRRGHWRWRWYAQCQDCGAPGRVRLREARRKPMPKAAAAMGAECHGPEGLNSRRAPRSPVSCRRGTKMRRGGEGGGSAHLPASRHTTSATTVHGRVLARLCARVRTTTWGWWRAAIDRGCARRCLRDRVVGLDGAHLPHEVRGVGQREPWLRPPARL